MFVSGKMRFKDKVVIITGALGGIGRACARQFASEGASLVLVDRVDADAGFNDMLGDLGGGAVTYKPCDVSVEGEVVAVCAAIEAELGRIDVIVNIAGAMIYTGIADLTGDDWHRLLGVNFMGAVFFTREGFRRMKPGGAIVNISSVHAVETSPLVAPYAAAKAALGSLTRSSAIEGAALGIRANAILPGAIDTPMLWASPNLKSGAETLAPGDIGKPEHVAHAAAFLASPEAEFITGASLNVDGGRLAKL